MKRWYNEFNRGRHSLTDQFRKGRPKSVVGPENINAVQKLIMQDRYMTYCETDGTLSISSTSIYQILHEHLDVKKICSSWIPHNLTKPHVLKMSQAEWYKCYETWFKRMQKCIGIKKNTLKNNKVIFDDKLLFFIIRLKI